MDQCLESPFEAPSTHEVSATLSNQEDKLDDVIERIERLNLNAKSSQPMEELGPSQKASSKWLIKTLESVHPNKVKNIGTKGSTKQDGNDR